MTSYRAFFYNTQGLGAATHFDADSQADAIAVGNSFYHAASPHFFCVEIWRGAERLAKIEEALPLAPPSHEIDRTFVAAAQILCNQFPTAVSQTRVPDHLKSAEARLKL